MRWIHIDDMVELKEGEYARAIRAIPSDADYLEDHFPGFPVMPQSLLIESMAQTAGILIGKSSGFKRDIILAKIDRAEFFVMARPGDRLTIDARIEELREEGAKVKCRITLDGREVGRSTLVFAVLPEEGVPRLGARNFVFSGGLLSLFKLRKDLFST